ncbi:HAD-IA family hydrolase [Synechocystis sp. PCC 7509]|uniref:HAD-IA family hydrolase n=1 Tax=Synechocystis sp. PCC 7509 TaxID=927677 RepID=UPI0002ACC214|nr:HAD-IA family hydrolase [Synechocystis sp. PCC 7509]
MEQEDIKTINTGNLLIVDMDGTVRSPRSDNKFIQRPGDQKVIPGADGAIAYFVSEGWKVIGVTNQAGVEAGKKSLTSCVKEQQQTMILLPEIEEVYFCPDFAGKKCFCVTPKEVKDYSKHPLSGTFRKPNPGMLLLVMDLHKADKIMFVGDRIEDKQAAQSVKLCAGSIPGARLYAKIKFQQADNWRRTYGDF